MGKRKGFDPVADAQELAEHNMNPYYWVNRVTSFTYARWMAEKKIAIIFIPFYVIMTILFIGTLPDAFRNGYGLPQVAALLVFAFVTVAEVVMVIQQIYAWRHKPAPPDIPLEKKKRLPKRRKDYH